MYTIYLFVKISHGHLVGTDKTVQNLMTDVRNIKEWEHKRK